MATLDRSPLHEGTSDSVRTATPSAREIIAKSDLAGRTALVTGATSGIGIETARALACAGAELELGVRDVQRGERIAERIREESGSHVRVDRLDLCDLASVSAFAQRTADRLPSLDLLIANAGASKTPRAHTSDGLDVRFVGNHLGHFLLANRLRPQLAVRGARVVVLSSAAHKGRPICLADLAWQSRAHDMLSAYGESKTANILFAMEATRRWGRSGVYANAVLPGSILTGLQRYHGEALMRTIGLLDEHGEPDPILRTAAQGAATSVWAAVSLDLEGRGGLVLEDCAEAHSYTPEMHPWTGYDPEVLDEASAELLWNASAELLHERGFDV